MRPEPVPDLDWGPAEARELTGEVLNLWCELLDRMRDLPVTPVSAADDVAAEMALPIPEAHRVCVETLVHRYRQDGGRIQPAT